MELNAGQGGEEGGFKSGKPEEAGFKEWRDSETGFPARLSKAGFSDRKLAETRFQRKLTRKGIPQKGKTYLRHKADVSQPWCAWKPARTLCKALTLKL